MTAVRNKKLARLLPGQGIDDVSQGCFEVFESRFGQKVIDTQTIELIDFFLVDRIGNDDDGDFFIVLISFDSDDTLYPIQPRHIEIDKNRIRPGRLIE